VAAETGSCLAAALSAHPCLQSCGGAAGAPAAEGAHWHHREQGAHVPAWPCKPMLACVLLRISSCGAKLQALGSFWIHAGGGCCYLALATSRFSVSISIPRVGRSSRSSLSPWGSRVVLCKSPFSV